MRALIWVVLLCVLGCGGSAGGHGGESTGAATNAEAPCSAPTDCGTWHTPQCGAWACPAGVCVLQFIDARTPVGPQSVGDCHYIGCDGGGSLTDWYDGNDVDDDGDPCTDDFCDGYTPQHATLAPGSTCGTFILSGPWGSAVMPKTCDASGACVPACQDGVKNQTETDIDCGGVYPCAPCPNGKACTGVQDCQSKRCTGGVCLPCFSPADCLSGGCVAGFCQ